MITLNKVKKTFLAPGSRPLRPSVELLTLYSVLHLQLKLMSVFVLDVQLTGLKPDSSSCDQKCLNDENIDVYRTKRLQTQTK